jgi:hypothetical protein
MVMAVALTAGISMLLAACWWKLRRLRDQKVELEDRIRALTLIVEGMNPTHGRWARQVAWRSQSIRHVLRDIPGLDAEARHG